MKSSDKLQTNRSRLVELSVMGEIAPPSFPAVPASPYLITRDGHPELIPSFGSIVYNVKIGDSAFGWVGDRIQPGASIKSVGNANNALNVFACVGNMAVVMSGSAVGARGIVVGKSGRFAEHVIIHFASSVLEELAFGDKIQVRAFGRGFKVDGHPDVETKSFGPNLADAMELRTTEDSKLEAPVVMHVPALLLGPGAGLTSEGGALNIQTSDPAAVEKFGLNNLRLGDLVAIDDYDSRYGHGYLRGAIGIGIICQTDSPLLGHGPGMALLMTSHTGGIATRIDPNANLAHLLDLPV